MESHNIARTREGHAAQAGVDKWVLIQENTFRNWVNEQLRPAGQEVNNLEEDFDSGVRLCALIQALQGKRIRAINNPRNHHQQLANVATALTAIADDNIKLVNIGPEDIVNGNLKLILGLIWHLILRYQIGKSKFPTKKLMICWLQAVIPECKITNFTSDWNDGVALHALIDFCRPGLCPEWRHLSRSDRLDNCRNAMMLAKQHFDIPLVVRPEDLSSSDLDELSGMTYLSYFMKLDSPGYHATLNLVRRLLKSGTVNNFTSDWSDGQLLCKLVNSLGGNVSGWPAMSDNPVENMQRGIDGAKGLGVEPILAAKEMCDPEVDHIGIMAYAAYFMKFKPVRSASEKVVFAGLPNHTPVGQEASFSISLEDDDVSAGDIRAEIIGPDSTHNVHFNWVGRTGQGYFTPTETGLHRLNVFCEGHVINGCPASFKVMADRSKVTFNAAENCSVGALTELMVNSATAGDGDVKIEVRAPSGRSMNLSAVPRHGGNYISNFNPTEVGEWEVSVLYDDEHISGSPYLINVFDPSLVKVYGLESGSLSSGITFNTDATKAGRGDVKIEMMKNGVDMSEYCLLRQEYNNYYKIDFNPPSPGMYDVHVYFNDMEIRGSPYNLDIVDSSDVTVSGDGLNLVPVNRTASFEVHAGRGGKVDVDITSPKGYSVPAKVNETASGSYNVNFVPTNVGDHKINVYYGGQLVKGCPYTLRVYDASRVVVGNMPAACIYGEQVTFLIDASQAGSGNIEIMINDGEIACSVQNHGNYKFTASFYPANMEDHRIEMKFNSEQVPGSPWNIKVADPGKMSATGSGLDFVQINRTALFSINMKGMDRKKLSVKILAFNGASVPAKIEPGSSGFNVEYIPTEVGDHTIEVMYADSQVNGSPFIAKAYDTNAIEVTKLPDGAVGQPIEFGIDVRKAGEGQLEIMVNSGNLPNTVESDETGVYRMSFVPEETGIQTVDIIFNKESHPRSPFTCNAVDLNQASVRDLDLQLPVDRTTSFIVNSESIGQDLNCNVDVLSPSGEDVAVKYNSEGHGIQRIEFVPKQVGVHNIHVTYLGAPIGDSPYQVKTYDPKLVRLSKMPLGILNIPFKFRVLGDEAGDGKMEVTVETEGQKIPTELEAMGEGTFEVTFMGDGERMHTLSVLFNGEHIPVSPMNINFADVDLIRIKKPSTYLVPCNHQINLQVTSAPSAIDDLVIRVDGPVYNKVPHIFHEIGNRLYCLNWMPIKPGTYDVDVKYGDVIPVWGSPMKFKAFDSTKVAFVDRGNTASVGERHAMTFNIKDAGEGELKVIIICQGETIQSAIQEEREGLVQVSYQPDLHSLYEVFVSFNGEPVPGSPFKLDLRKPEDNKNEKALVLQNTRYLIVEQLQWCFIQSLGYILPLDQLIMYITAPNGERVLADIYRQGSGDFKVEWTPRVAGRHTVDVQFGGRQVDGSPFYVDVFDLSTIRVDNFRNGLVGDEAGFCVDFSNAGTLDQEIRIVGPSGIDVVYDSRELGYLWKDYIYEPEEPGNYRIYIKYGGFELPGCPFTQDIADGGLPTASGQGLFFGEEDKPTQFNVDVGRRKGDLRVSVSGPNSIAKCSVDPQDDGSYTVTYVPVETGLFDIRVTWNDTDIPGSPYHPKVVDARKVRIIGGWQHFYDSNERVNLVVNETKQLPFDVSEAGPGTFRAEVQGPSYSIDSTIDNHTSGRVVVEFVPKEEGTHYIHLFWSDIPLVNSPFLGFAVQHTPDASKLILTGRGLKEAVVREEAEFVIDGSQAGRGNPDVVLSGVRAEVNVNVSPIGNGRFRCTYVPILPGAYLLHITWNGRQLRGSPYKVNVIGAFYPNRVVVSGVGGAILGREMNVGIDTRKAGPGELTAYCMGPHQVAYCELEDNHDGTFRLAVKAQESGRHVLQIKYGGEHVQGSPFIYKVTAQPDASKVRVHGPGVEHGILATYISRFIVETRGAGAGQLTVRIRGPKGAFQVEMYRDSQRDRTILCKFDPTECGLYIISVKWSGVDVPGSPFHVHILDTQEELEQVLNEVSYSIGTSHSHHGGSSRISHHGGGSSHISHATPRMVYGQWRDQI
ncbi:hypothetical protein ACF0H5_021155 [Mactra antiquata]